ncbi:hypothetical protein AWENTII_002160 [Aspergillus wentii]
MAENYTIATSFLRERNIRYSESNAGLFIWLDLRHLLLPQSSLQSDYGVLRVASPDASIYKQREMQIADICAANGVMIAPGHIYMPEECGWFRMTFTVGKEALAEGLDRLARSLEQVEADIQNV